MFSLCARKKKENDVTPPGKEDLNASLYTERIQSIMHLLYALKKIQLTYLTLGLLYMLIFEFQLNICYSTMPVKNQ